MLQAAAFEDTLVSFLAEGVLQKFPGTKLVLMESGFAWLPTLLWRTNRSWRGVRTEVPWIDRAPAEIVRDHVRFTLQPLDVPNGDVLNRIMDHVRSDELIVFSTDYPHWQFDGEDALPDGLIRYDGAQNSDRQSAGDLSAPARGVRGGEGGAKPADARGDGAMNKPVPERETKAAQRLGFVDCDIHPVQRTPKDLYPYLDGALARA